MGSDAADTRDSYVTIFCTLQLPSLGILTAATATPTEGLVTRTQEPSTIL